MKLIPEEWSIGLISQFLSGSLRLSLHKSRTTKMLSSLARGENIKVSDKNSCLGQISRAFVDSYPIIPSIAAYNPWAYTSCRVLGGGAYIPGAYIPGGLQPE